MKFGKDLTSIFTVWDLISGDVEMRTPDLAALYNGDDDSLLINKFEGGFRIATPDVDIPVVYNEVISNL